MLDVSQYLISNYITESQSRGNGKKSYTQTNGKNKRSSSHHPEHSSYPLILEVGQGLAQLEPERENRRSRNVSAATATSFSTKVKITHTGKKPPQPPVLRKLNTICGRMKLCPYFSSLTNNNSKRTKDLRVGSKTLGTVRGKLFKIQAQDKDFLKIIPVLQEILSKIIKQNYMKLRLVYRK